MAQWLLFVITTAIVLATPGPTNTLLAASAALVGVRRSLPLILAELGGYGLSISVLLASGSAIAAFPGLEVGLRLCLAAYLLFVAWRLWGASAARAIGTVDFRTVLITTALNPKALIFAFAVFPPIRSPDEALRYGGLFALVTMLVASGWIMLGGSAGLLASPQRSMLIRRLAAIALVVFASGVAGTAIAR
jgi:threonine/homoserine/homoserine lactone efflux protein